MATPLFPSSAVGVERGGSATDGRLRSKARKESQPRHSTSTTRTHSGARATVPPDQCLSVSQDSPLTMQAALGAQDEELEGGAERARERNSPASRVRGRKPPGLSPAPAAAPRLPSLTRTHVPTQTRTGPTIRPAPRTGGSARPAARPAGRHATGAPPAPCAEPPANAGFDPRLSSDEIEQWQAPGKSATPLLVS